jgi:hypothetical protein
VWIWFFGGYAAFVAILVGYAAHVALSGADERHRADAYRVLKLIWCTATGSGGLLAILLKLYQTGLM